MLGHVRATACSDGFVDLSKWPACCSGKTLNRTVRCAKLAHSEKVHPGGEVRPAYPPQIHQPTLFCRMYIDYGQTARSTMEEIHLWVRWASAVRQNSRSAGLDQALMVDATVVPQLG
jgi:hypothetical protein